MSGVGQMIAGYISFVAGGKSGLHRAGCWVTPSLGDEEESATESKPPPALARGVRVKR